MMVTKNLEDVHKKKFTLKRQSFHVVHVAGQAPGGVQGPIFGPNWPENLIGLPGIATYKMRVFSGFNPF